MSTVLCLALRTFFLLSMYLYIPFSSTLLAYFTVLFAFSILHSLPRPGAHRKQTADWFFQGSIFNEWKSDGPLLWLHGKRTFS
jgi:hypothetical protein